MRLLIFADIHGNAYALDAFIKLLPGIDYDEIIFLGDIFGYYYDQQKCIDSLKNISDLIWLKGNHDVYAVNAFHDENIAGKLIQSYGHSYDEINERFSMADIEFIETLKPSLEINVEGKRVGLFHGRPADPLEGRIYIDTELSEQEFENLDIVFFGHTHCKIDRTVGETRLLSPGSLGQPRDGKGYGFLIYDSETEICQYINIDVDNELLRKEIERKDNDLQKLYDVLSREGN